MYRTILVALFGLGLSVATSWGQTESPPQNIADIIATIQKEFPDAGITVTGRARTVKRQAELMSAQIRADAKTFDKVYPPAASYNGEMHKWIKDNPNASKEDATAAFTDIINTAIKNGARVSNHLSDSARDTKIPTGDAKTLEAIESRLRELGAKVLPEPNAKDGAHWHIDFIDTPKAKGGASNTGPYKNLAEDDRKLVPLDVPRSQRMNRLQGISPMKSGFGGVLLGNGAKKAPAVKKAAFLVDKSRVKLSVEIGDDPAVYTYADMTMTELWTAYHFLRPNKELMAQGAIAGDLGLVGIAKNRIKDNGSWDFGIHPAIADTHLALDAMRLDMSLTLGDPRLPKLPAGWTTYRWYDEASEIVAKNGAIRIFAAQGPRHMLLRVTLWTEQKEVLADTIPFVLELYRRFDGLRQMERFARLVALLNWLDTAGQLPDLPEAIQPRKIRQANRCFLSQVGFAGGEITRYELSREDSVGRARPGCHFKTHVLHLAQGQDVVIDMTSSNVDSYLRLEDPRGQKIAEDDDGGGGKTARISFRAKETGYYRVLATTFDLGAIGAYHLNIWDSPAPSTWIGRTILLKKAGVKFGHTGENGEQVYLGTLVRPDHVVLDEQAGWIKVGQGRLQGWFDKDEALTAENALSHFGQAIQRNARDSWALASLATARELRGELRQALHDFERAAQFDPERWTKARDRVRSALD